MHLSGKIKFNLEKDYENLCVSINRRVFADVINIKDPEEGIITGFSWMGQSKSHETLKDFFFPPNTDQRETRERKTGWRNGHFQLLKESLACSRHLEFRGKTIFITVELLMDKAVRQLMCIFFNN